MNKAAEDGRTLRVYEEWAKACAEGVHDSAQIRILSGPISWDMVRTKGWVSLLWNGRRSEAACAHAISEPGIPVLNPMHVLQAQFGMNLKVTCTLLAIEFFKAQHTGNTTLACRNVEWDPL